MRSVLGSIFGFGNKLKRNLREAVSNPSGYIEEITNKLEHSRRNKNPEISRGQLWKRPLTEDEKTEQAIENGLGFFNPVPLGIMGNFAMRKELGDAVANLSRRDFLKKSAGLAGGTAAASIPGAKLLQKFAPEERAIAKEAVTEAAPKYKYNSLKEYLDDVTDYSHDIGHERAYESAMEHGYNNHPGADRYMDNFVDNFDFSKIQRERLLADETAYKEAKRNLSSLSPKKDPKTGLPPQSQRDLIDSFSPQAKKEMKEFKSLTKQIDTDYTGSHDWTQWAIKNSEDPTKIVEELKKWYIP